MSEIQLIKEYLKNNFESLPDDNKQFLLLYVAKKYKYGEINREDQYEVSNITIRKDLKVLNNNLSAANDTSLTIARIDKLLDLIGRLVSASSESDLYDISFDLEKLYLEVGMPIRNTDTVIRKITNSNSRKRSRD